MLWSFLFYIWFLLSVIITISFIRKFVILFKITRIIIII
nr:MAG TPA: hypothetical protein [Bacteriophage sp.]